MIWGKIFKTPGTLRSVKGTALRTAGGTPGFQSQTMHGGGYRTGTGRRSGRPPMPRWTCDWNVPWGIAVVHAYHLGTFCFVFFLVKIRILQFQSLPLRRKDVRFVLPELGVEPVVRVGNIPGPPHHLEGVLAGEGSHGHDVGGGNCRTPGHTC